LIVLAHLVPGFVFIDIKIIDTEIASAARIMVCQTHNTGMTDYTNKKCMMVAENNSCYYDSAPTSYFSERSSITHLFCLFFVIISMHLF
jgi:hypothetical protein